MNPDNPYEAPNKMSSTTSQRRRILIAIGTGILLFGLAVLAYGATAFWLINSLPPNGGANGRLPSLYVMGIGIVVAVIGLIARDLRVGNKGNASADVASKEIPTSYGILFFIVILIIFFVVVSRL